MLAPFYALQSGNFWCKVLIILYSQASICYHGKRMSLKFCSIFFYSWYNILCFIEILLSLVGTTHKHCISLLGAGIATGIEDIFLLFQICQGFWMVGCRGIFLFFFFFALFIYLFIFCEWGWRKEEVVMGWLMSTYLVRVSIRKRLSCAGFLSLINESH